MSFEKPWGNYLLEGIVETIAPQNISFWPQTIAWQLIFIVLTIVIIKKIYRTWQEYQANAYRREALAWLAQCSLANEDDIRQLPALLRKTALLANEVNRHDKNSLESSSNARKRRQDITGLTGKFWAAWLDSHCTRSDFSKSTQSASCASLSNEALLTQLAYIPKLDLNDSEFNSALKKLCQQITLWVQHHQLLDENRSDDLGEQT